MKLPRYRRCGFVGSLIACAFLAVTPLYAVKVLFVGGQAEATQGADAAVMTFLEEKYGAENITYVQSGPSQTSDADGMDLVVLSSTPGSGDIRTKFRDVEAGLVNWEEALADAPRDGNFPFIAGGRPKSQQTDWKITDVAHPITEGLAGTDYTLWDPEAETWSGQGELGAGVLVLATDPEENGGTLMVVDTGGLLLNDIVSAGRRVMLGMTDDTANNFTDEGWALFGRALDWAADNLGNPSIALDFNTDPGDSFMVANTLGAPSEWRATGGVHNSGYYSITDNANDTNSTRNTLIFPDISDGWALRGFDFRVDLRMGGGTRGSADGFSLNLVTPEDPLLQDPVGVGFAGLDIGGLEEDLPEEGSQTGLGIGFDAWASGDSDVVGISVRVDGILIDQLKMPTLNGEADDATSLQTGPQNLDDPNDPTGLLTWQPFRAFLEPDTNKLTIEWKGEVLMDGVEVPWVPTSVIPVFAARTGGANDVRQIDNFSLEMVPAPLASLGARTRGKELIITGTTGPESQFDAESLAVMLDLDGDGTQEVIEVGAGVVDGNRRVYTFEPSASFFEPNSVHGFAHKQFYTVTAQDSLGNALRAEGVWEVARTNTFSGGFFTTQHVWSAGDQISDAATARAALAGDISLQGDITVRHPYAHFHDNKAGFPIQADLSIPYPLWAEPDQIPDENIIAGERIGGGLGARDDFAIRSTGEFFIRNGGNIHFFVFFDDGFDLLIDGESIGEGNRPFVSMVRAVELDAGTHTMELIHWGRGGGARVSLYIGRAPDLANAGVNGHNFQVLSGFNIHDCSTEDTDGDGMDDFKETFFFGDLSRDGSGDFDEDGLIDSEELALRSDPTVKDSDGDGLDDGRDGSGDFDEDGLIDSEELALGSDPTVKDSDGDGLEDGPEVHEFGTDLANVDSDGDGLADGHEVNDLGTDPTKTDTDDDGFGDNVEVALGNDPLDAEDKPDAIFAVAAGNWNDPATWSDGQAPGAGKNYVVGTVTGKLVSAAGTFAGDSLTLIGPGMTLELNHSGNASANIALNNANITVARAVSLGGKLSITGDVHIAVGNNALTLASQLSGSGNLTIQGGSETDFQGNVELTGAGSNFAGPLNIIGTGVAGISPGSLGTGSILLASGGVAFGYNYSSPAAILKIQWENLRIVLGGEITMADIVGVNADGDVLFSLNELAGPGPYDADLLLQALESVEGISGDGSITLLGIEGDTDFDGLLDAWEIEHFGNLDATADGDADGDGLSNLAEQSAGTDPNEADPGDGGGPGPDPGADRPGVISAVVKADADGAVGFSFPAGTTFDVEYSIDLQTWIVIATDVTGDFQDTDAGRTAAAEGYYRGVAN